MNTRSFKLHTYQIEKPWAADLTAVKEVWHSEQYTCKSLVM